MPGMPQGRDINESGAKSVTLVTIADDRSIHLEERVTSVAQFESISIDLTGIGDWREMVAMLTKALQRKRDDVPSEHMVARLLFTGSTSLAWRLRYDHDVLKAEASDRAFVIGKSWIEKVEIECHAPNTTISPVTDPMTELRRLIEEEIRNSGAYQIEISNILDELRSQLPPECRHFLGSDEESSRRVVEKLVTEGSEDVLALLHAKASPEET